MSDKEKLPQSIRLDGLIGLLDRAAERDDRTRAQQIRHYLREGLRRDGLLPAR